MTIPDSKVNLCPHLSEEDLCSDVQSMGLPVVEVWVPGRGAVKYHSPLYWQHKHLVKTAKARQTVQYFSPNLKPFLKLV